MGKGYTNFMSKKAFHPGSNANQRRIREAEAQAEAKRKNDEEKLAQYQKEQELFNQKSLVSKQSKEKLSLNFMYEPPPGVEKPDSKPTDKVEWKGLSNKSASTSRPETQSSSAGEANICLEWKRDRPANKPSREPDLKPEIKQEQTIKKEPKIDPKTESRVDLKWKRELPEKKPRADMSLPDLKRIKKERY